MKNYKWKILLSLSTHPTHILHIKKDRQGCLSYFRVVGSPLALSPSLAGPFNIGNRKGRRFCNANRQFAT